MDSYGLFILSHENLAESLKKTIEKIIGRQENLFSFSNKTDSLQVIEEKIKKQIHKYNYDRNILFVDLVGGSCWSLANLMKKKDESLTVIGGVNLSMLVSIYMNYQKLDYEELIQKTIEDGKRGIVALGGKL